MKLSVSGIDFAYRSTPILENITFGVHPGEVLCILGVNGAGKSTLARRLAAEMGYIYVDTGAMFRTIGLYALRAGKDPKENDAVNALLPQIELRLASIEGEQHIYLKEEDVSTAIRTEAAGMAASAVGANPTVRAFLLEQVVSIDDLELADLTPGAG